MLGDLHGYWDIAWESEKGGEGCVCVCCSPSARPDWKGVGIWKCRWGQACEGFPEAGMCFSCVKVSGNSFLLLLHMMFKDTRTLVSGLQGGKSELGRGLISL